MSNSKYIRHDFNSVMGHLTEECGEVLSALGKMQRWGILSVNPELPPEEQETNRDWLLRELDDLEEVIPRARKLLQEYGGS